MLQQPSNFLTDEYYNPRKLRLTKIKINEIFTPKIFHNMKKLYKILFWGDGGGNFPGGNFPGVQFSGGQFSWGIYFRGALFPGAFFPEAFFLAPKSALSCFYAHFVRIFIIITRRLFLSYIFQPEGLFNSLIHVIHHWFMWFFIDSCDYRD